MPSTPRRELSSVKKSRTPVFLLEATHTRYDTMTTAVPPGTTHTRYDTMTTAVPQGTRGSSYFAAVAADHQGSWRQRMSQIFCYEIKLLIATAAVDSLPRYPSCTAIVFLFNSIVNPHFTPHSHPTPHTSPPHTTHTNLLATLPDGPAQAISG